MMAKAFFVTCLTALLFASAVAYAQECAVGPEYWCKSFQNADDCGAIRHCTDTVWNNDNKYTSVDSSSTCQWCQKILAKTQEGIKGFGDNQDLVASTLASACNLLPSTDLSSKCTNVIKDYETSVILLTKNQRYATLCHLMSICSIEKPSKNVGRDRCTWGPSYWCSSLSNTRECSSIDHCSDKIWSQQAIEKKENDNICKYCEFIIKKLRSYLTNSTTEINAEKWLAGACSMLRVKDVINKCVQTMSQYADEVVTLVKNDVDPGVICHLGEMCQEATIVTRVKNDDKPSEEPKIKVIDDQTKMLCNVIVRATHDLYIKQDKTQNEIETFLRKDCQQLATPELTKKCKELIDHHGNDIYGHVANNMELSKVCDYVADFGDATAFHSLPQVHCELCQFVLGITKHMLDNKESEDKVLVYIDEQLCSRLNPDTKKNCKSMIETNREELIHNIQQETHSLLLCNYFQVCFDEIMAEASPVQESEVYSFLKENLCDQLGPFQEACNALMAKDTTRFLKTLVNDMDGDVLCQLVGICPTKMSFIDNFSLNDHKNQCVRCIDDFTRRKHIAEKLVNHSADFLHHLCGQLPQEDDCIKSVDESVNKLAEFIQSLDPKDICLELKQCNASSLENIRITPSNQMMSEEIIKYVKNEICDRRGPLSKLCNQLMDAEGKNLLTTVGRYTDPHEVCSVIDICPKTKAFDNCNDKCECCISKVENYQVQLASFLQTMLSTATVVCEHIPDSEDCRIVADGFKATIDEMISHFNAKRVCQALTHCSSGPIFQCNTDTDKCQCCQNQLNSRENNFRTIINEIQTNLLSLCDDETCRSNIQLNHDKILNKINKIDSLTFCQRFGYCSSALVHRSIPFLSDLISGSTMEEFADNICSEFEDLKPICEHFMTSAQSDRYVKVYIALLQNNLTIIDEDLHAQVADTCETCKSSIQSAKDFWMNSLDSIRNVLLQACEHCPSKDQCQDLINQRFDNLKSYLDKIDPAEYCQTMHLCSVSLTDTCSKCIENLQLKKDGMLQAIDRLAGYFNDLCQEYSDKECQAYVKETKNSIQKSIEEFNPQQTCNSIGFCSTDESDFDQYKQSIDDEIEKSICSTLGPFETLCKLVVQGDTKQIQTLKINYDIKDLMKIGGESTEDLNECSDDKCKCCVDRIKRKIRHIKFIGDSIFFILTRSCDACPAKLVCRTVLRIAKSRFNAHLDHICPYQVCVHHGSCNKSSNITTEPIKPIDNSNSTCILCEYVMNILSNYIHSESTEEEIEESLQNICNQMPTILQNQCHDYVNNYGPAIIAILVKEFDPSTVCQKLNLCTKQMKFDITHITKADTASCGICDYISTYFHFSLKRDSNEKSFQHTLATVCSHLSEEQKPKCQIILQLFSSNIRQLELNPEKNFCKQLTICQTPMIELQPAVLINKESDSEQAVDVETLLEPKEQTPLKETPKCTLCHYIISYLDAALKNNISEQAVEQALEKVCTILPAKERDQCNEFIKDYGAVLANMLAELADPVTICRTLEMCDASETKKPTILVQTAYTCTVCQYIANRMKYFTGLKQGKTEVHTSIKEACDLFTVADLKEQCKNFLEQYESDFAQMIADDIEPRTACQSIGACDENNQNSTPPPISTSAKYGKCVFGMKYWCTSRANAELCNAVELCEREVWSKSKIVIN